MTRYKMRCRDVGTLDSPLNMALYGALYLEHFVESILADQTVSMSEFKKNPAAVLRASNNRPVAVLNHNRAAFYMVEPRLFEAIMDELADQDLYRKAVARLADKSRAVEVDLDDL